MWWERFLFGVQPQRSGAYSNGHADGVQICHDLDIFHVVVIQSSRYQTNHNRLGQGLEPGASTKRLIETIRAHSRGHESEEHICIVLQKPILLYKRSFSSFSGI